VARILLVDDEEQLRRVLGALLRDEGHEVTEVRSAEAALELWARAAPELVLLDQRLPGMDGLAALERLRALDPEVAVVLMTAFGTIRSAVEAMRRGAFDYLAKPFDNDELLLVVERALAVRRLRSEVASLRTELEARYGFSEILGISPQLQEVFRVMAKVAPVDATVLITGESGTGKELVARALHRRSRRAAGPFVAVNCSAIPAPLVEAEFFGHEKGAFTDARDARAGRFEQADGGTLFLDEVGDLAPEAQAKLLRALQERQVQRLGAPRPRPVDIRVVAATNKDLEAEVRRGAFREDLFWRLHVVHIALPPLRERPQDLPLLVDHLVERFNRELGLAVQAVAPEARRLLAAYPWPGNVRELENTLCRAMVLSEGGVLQAGDLPTRVRGDQTGSTGLAEPDLGEGKLADALEEAARRVEKAMIAARLRRHRGNRTLTAQSLGINRKTLFYKLREHGLAGDHEPEPEG
jgi:DNA-binding NtrC family response regulator